MTWAQVFGHVRAVLRCVWPLRPGADAAAMRAGAGCEGGRAEAGLRHGVLVRWPGVRGSLGHD
ncbi:hypothetical protein NB713_003802 [Xanthomonas sacchari]|nr:hypothetical protein [Xanthomonas sacchari]